MKIGLLGGTFDPVHYGHIELAGLALRLAELEVVYLVTAAIPPHKVQGAEASYPDRHAMVSLAAMNQSKLIPSSLEYNRYGKSYSIDTIQQLKRLFGKSSEVFFIMGLDTFFDIACWKDFDLLPELCRFLIFSRPGSQESQLGLKIPKEFLNDIYVIKDKNESILQVSHRFVLYQNFSNSLSSTDIRKRLWEGKDVSEQLPPAVNEYIIKNCLYRGTSI